MSLKLAGQLFTGPFPIDATIIRANQQPVVFAVIAKGGPGWAPVFRVIDVGYSEDSGLDFSNHAQKQQWIAASDGVPDLYFLYMPKSQYSIADRWRIAEDIRRRYDPPHGLVQG
jgi:hypothetical protein